MLPLALRGYSLAASAPVRSPTDLSALFGVLFHAGASPERYEAAPDEMEPDYEEDEEGGDVAGLEDLLR